VPVRRENGEGGGQVEIFALGAVILMVLVMIKKKWNIVKNVVLTTNYLPENKLK